MYKRQPWKDPKALGMPKMPLFSDNAILPSVLGVHIGWIIALLLVAAVYLFMNHSKKGFEIAILGESLDTARYAGINIRRTMLLAVFLSGALSDVYKRQASSFWIKASDACEISSPTGVSSVP